MTAYSQDSFTLVLSPEDCASVVSALVHSEVELRNYRPKSADEYRAARERIVRQLDRESQQDSK